MEDILSTQFTHPGSEQRETLSRKRERMIFVKGRHTNAEILV